MKVNFNPLKQEAPYLDSSRNRLLHIAFLSVFTFIFLSVYSPFNMNEWGGDILGYVLIGSAYLFLSQFIFRRVLGLQKFKLYQLIIWAILETIIITFFIYLVYGVEFETIEQKINEYLITLKYVGLVTAGPYILSLWYLSGTSANHRDSGKKEVPNSNELLNIESDNGKVIFAIQYEQLLYIQSSGNYIEIHYLKGGKPAKELIRMSFKELESKVSNSNMIRIHRSYMVNKNKISSFKKTRKGYELMPLYSQEILPVSSGYKDSFELALELRPTR